MLASKAVNSPLPPLALIAGPTASGKSALALALAEAVDGVIVNADASQVYRDLRILSARPSPEDEARAPHRLYGTRDAAEPTSAAAWAAEARTVIAETHATGRVPILVGGTGLYIRTLIDGIAPVPEIAPEVRAEVRAMTVEEAHVALSREDPPAASRLGASDTTRVARALEVVRSTGRTLAQWQAERVGGIGNAVRLAPLVLLPPRDWLRERCDARFQVMLDAGAIEEVRALRARGLDPALPAMRAIGVREIGDWLEGATDRVTMIVRAQAATRRYAKRQATWFAHQPPPAWDRLNTQLQASKLGSVVIRLRKNLLTR